MLMHVCAQRAEEKREEMTGKTFGRCL